MPPPSILSIVDKQPNPVWCLPIERAPKSRRQVWNTAIRAIILVVLVAAATTLLAVAYAPRHADRPSVPPQLSCTPVVVAACDTLSAQTSGVPEYASAPIATGGGVTSNSDHSIESLKQERRAAVKASHHRSAANAGTPKESATSGAAKHRSAVANQKESKRYASPETLAQAGTYRSPFNDMHGQ